MKFWKRDRKTVGGIAQGKRIQLTYEVGARKQGSLRIIKFSHNK